MKNGASPNPNTVHPIPGYDKEIYVKPTITNPNIYIVHDWLQEKSHFDTDPEGKVFYLMDADPALLGEYYVDSAFINSGNAKEIYSNGTIHIYEFESAESFKNSGLTY